MFKGVYNTLKWYLNVLGFLKRRFWYILLLVVSSIYVFNYRFDIFQLKEINAQNLVYLLWLVLLLFPLFSEMEVFGIKLKKEIEKTKADVKESISELKMQIMEMRFSNSSIINNHISPYSPLLSEDEMKKQKQEMEALTSPKNKNAASDENALGVSDQSVYLFKIRLSIEKRLSEICDKIGYEGNKVSYQMLRHLLLSELIDNRTSDLVHQVVKIANRGIHGEIVSDEYMDYVKTAIPVILDKLDEANARLSYCVCPRCKHSGYSRFSNVCPRCGFTSDED